MNDYLNEFEVDWEIFDFEGKAKTNEDMKTLKQLSWSFSDSEINAPARAKTKGRAQRSLKPAFGWVEAVDEAIGPKTNAEDC